MKILNLLQKQAKPVLQSLADIQKNFRAYTKSNRFSIGTKVRGATLIFQHARMLDSSIATFAITGQPD